MKFKKFIATALGYWKEIQSKKHSIRKFYFEYLRSTGRFIYTSSGVISLVVLIAEFGFYYPEEWVPYVRFLVSLLVDFFLVYEVLSFLFTSKTVWEYIKTHKLELVIIFLILVEKVYEDDIISMLKEYHLTGNDTTLIFLSTNQILFIFANLAHFFRISKFYDVKNISPSLVFVGSFALIILIGSSFLHFPKATTKPVSTIDIVFTTISATCVTGLSTISIAEDFTITGQLILLALIQVGGLGLMTLTSFFSFFLAGQASVTDKLLLKDLLSEESIGKVKGLLKQIAYQTFLIEFVGAVLLYFSFPEESPLPHSERIYFSVFHSISAFCNAGFSLIPQGLSDPIFFKTESFLSVIMVLIMLGGIGFPVLGQIKKRIMNPRDRHFRWSITSRLVLSTSTILWIFGTVAYFMLEQNHTLQSLSTFDQIFHSLFYSVTTRTAGFNTLDLTQMGIPITFISFFLMWVGASPISTGGGIKTTTLAISFFNILNQIRGRANLEIHYRSIAPSTIIRASATIVLSLFIIFLAIFGMVIVETAPFIDICYEVVSAFGTVGLTRGLTPGLTSTSKIILCSVMFVGRVGILTLLIAVTKQAVINSYKYPLEYVVVG
ncbi:TrkH family potassium uptake protein [Leptospira idonii]|uniref:Portal protein n=1 Tax=Leptospira idonii TaxID=1193500 RepID=A0A4R9M6Z9_9LEPT|nr:potassium transporter TrkG [Leptospira idonii]TGN20428.1 portal protein [Leptospira idonii]